MNYYEAEIAKYEKRIERIERTPSRVMLASNKLLYQAQLDNNKASLKCWHEKGSFVGIGGSDLALLVRAFGDFQILNLGRMADQLGTDRAEASIEKLRAMGLPDYSCDRTILYLPLIFMGDDLPRPKLILSRTGGCEVVNDTRRTLGNLLGVPTFTIEVPFEDPHEQHLGYVLSQIEELIAFVEAKLPGAKFNESKLIELHGLARRWCDAIHDIYELRKRVPCPDHPRDVFREPLWPGQFANPSLIVKYYETYRDELRERAERKWTPAGEEKLRIAWAVSGPYGSNVWDYLVERGVSIPCWLYGGGLRTFSHTHYYGDTTQFGRKLSTLEEEARMKLYNSWGGTGERWIRDVLFACKEYRAEGLVLFEQTGCMPVCGMGRIVAQRMEEELGIPTWRVEGRQLIGRSERTEAEFMAGLEAFINLCFERKKGR